MAESYDALLIVAFGGPEGPDDVMPFLENVLRGRNVPRERMLEVAEHYYHFDGRSPINDQNRALIAELEKLQAGGATSAVALDNVGDDSIADCRTQRVPGIAGSAPAPARTRAPRPPRRTRREATSGSHRALG